MRATRVAVAFRLNTEGDVRAFHLHRRQILKIQCEACCERGKILPGNGSLRRQRRIDGCSEWPFEVPPTKLVVATGDGGAVSDALLH